MVDLSPVGPREEQAPDCPVAGSSLLCDAFERVRQQVAAVVRRLDDQALHYRPTPEANPVAWLVWHLTRVQDDHVAEAAGTDQVWIADGWADRLDLPYDRDATGYGQDAGEVGALRIGSSELLTGYHDAVCARTIEFVSGLDERGMARVVDASWNPPVTLGVRLVSVIADDLQHIGQAAYVKGLLPRS